MAWVVDFYEDEEGNAPVEEYLDGLTVQQRVKVLALIKQLEQHGPTLPFPYSSQVEGKLRELRTKFGKTRLRVLYFGDANQVFQLLHGLIKDTEKLEQSDIDKGKERMLAHEEKLREAKEKKEKKEKTEKKEKKGKK
jgi:phage-related protein